MLINRALVDWITLTTFAREHDLWDCFASLTPEDVRKESRRLQYHGSAGPHSFWGTGVQAGRQHAMLQVSGELADEVTLFVVPYDINCTRLDLQVTIAMPTGYDSREVYDGLIDPLAKWGGRRKNASIVQSGDGLDTIYIGSRTSEKFARLYVKPDADGLPAFLRFEVEYKKATAHGVYQALWSGKHTRATILAHEVKMIPLAKFALVTRFLDALGTQGTNPPVKRVRTHSNTIEWLETQVEPAIIRLLNDHEHHGTIVAIINRWLGNANR